MSSTGGNPLNSKGLYAKLKESISSGKFGRTVKKLGKDLLRIKDELGQTVLHLAASDGNVAFFQELLEGKDGAALLKSVPGLLEEKDKNDWRPLHCATSAGELSVVSILVKSGADVTAPTIEDATCLHYFPKISPPSAAGAATLYQDTLRAILGKTTNVNQVNKRGQTALHRAAAEGLARRGQLIHALLSKDCDLTIRDGIGETPLHAACRIGDEGLVSLLLQKGADITIRGENGTPLTIAKEEKNDKIVSILEKFAKDKGITLTKDVAETKTNKAEVQSELLLAKRDKTTPDDPPEEQQQRNARRRVNIVKEIVESEKTHVKALTDLVSIFLEPMMHQEIESVLTPAELKMFYPESLGPIFDAHTKILAQLKAKAKNWADTKIVAEIYHNVLAPTLQSFKAYATNVDTCYELLKKVVTSVTKDSILNSVPNGQQMQKIPFLYFLTVRNAKRGHRQSSNMSSGGSRSSVAPQNLSRGSLASHAISNRASTTPQHGLAALVNSGGLVAGSMISAAADVAGLGQSMEAVNDFAGLILAPLARVSRYTRLFRDLLQFTPKTHGDYKLMLAALETIDKIAETVLEAKAATEMKNKITAIDDSISGNPEPLYRADREHIRDGAIQIKVKPSKGQPVLTPAWLYLFNDTLLYAKKVQPDKTNKTGLQFLRNIPLKGIISILNVDSEGKGAFEIGTDKAEKELFIADNEDQRHNWVAAIGAATAGVSAAPPWKKLKFKGPAPTVRASATISAVGKYLFLFGGNFRSTHYNDFWTLNTEAEQKLWVRLEETAAWPSPRSEHTAVVADGKIFIFGGFDGKKRLNDLHCYDPTTKKWTQPKAKGTPPAERSGHSMVLGPAGTNMIVFGGIDSNGKYLNDLYSLIVNSVENTATWTLISPDEGSQIPEARAYHSIAVVEDYLVVYGGYSFTKCFDECELFDTDANTWIRFPEGNPAAPPAASAAPSLSSSALVDISSAPEVMRPAARHGHGCFVFNNTMYIIGGSSYAGNVHFGDVWSMSIAGKESIKWTKLPVPFQLENRHKQALSLVESPSDPRKSNVWIFGGLVGVTTNPTYRNDLLYIRSLRKLTPALSVGTSTTPPSASMSASSSGKRQRERGATITTLAAGSIDLSPNATAAANSLSSAASDKEPRDRSVSTAVLRKHKTTGSKSAPNTPGSFTMSAHRRGSVTSDESSAESSESPVDVLTEAGVLDKLTLSDTPMYPSGSASSAPTSPTFVYKASYNSTEQVNVAIPLAVKITKGTKLADAYRSEIEALRDIHHPNLAEYYAAGEKNGDVWVLMEAQLASLVTLSRVTEHVYTEPQMAIIARAVLCGLIQLQAKKLTAKHVRPDNIVIGDNGTIRLINYSQSGMKKLDTKQMKAADLAQVTYLAPELRSAKETKDQKTAAKSNPMAADIWALAVTLINLSEAQLDASDESAADPPLRTSGSTGPTVSSRSSLSTSDTFKDFIGKCLVPFPDQRADPAQLLAHRFITDNCPYARAPADSAIPTANHKLDRGAFSDVLLSYKKKRAGRRESRANPRDSTLWADGVVPSSPRREEPSHVPSSANLTDKNIKLTKTQSRKSNSDRPSSARGKPRKPDIDSDKRRGSSNRSSDASDYDPPTLASASKNRKSSERLMDSDTSSDSQPTSKKELESLRDEYSKYQLMTAGRMAKLEQKLADKDDAIEKLQKQLTQLSKQQQDSPATTASQAALDKSAIDAIKLQIRNELLAELRRESDGPEAKPKPQTTPPSPAAYSSAAATEGVGRRPSESTLNALSLELDKSSGSVPPSSSTIIPPRSPRIDIPREASPSPPKGNPKLSPGGPKGTGPRPPTAGPPKNPSTSNLSRTSYATISMPKPSLVTNKSRIMDRIMFFDKPPAAGSATSPGERPSMTRQTSTSDRSPSTGPRPSASAPQIPSSPVQSHAPNSPSVVVASPNAPRPN